MAQIIKSGAFLQQCWSVHPLCVTVKRMAEARTLVLTCSACKFAHHLVLGAVLPKESAAPAQPPSETDGEKALIQCVAQHRTALTMREMDVFQDVVLLRCAECRRHYEVTIASFSSHQR
jgi:hypothetical protein